MDEELKSELPEHESVPGDAAALVTERAAAGVSGGRMPAMYLGHGAPPLVDDPLWTTQLAAWAGALPRPSAILVVSAHWESAPLAIGATQDAAPLLYDFYGFPERYYRATYPAPGAPDLATRVGAMLSDSEPVAQVPDRGLDHGAYVPLVEMYPDADVPVLQVSMPTLDPAELMRIGRKLAPLRDEGVLIVGSGFFTHNLRALTQDGSVHSIMTEFDDWGRRALEAQDVDALLDFEHKAPAGHLAHPRTEHFAPLFVTLGASENELGSGRSVIDGFWMGLSKRSLQFG